MNHKKIVAGFFLAAIAITANSMEMPNNQTANKKQKIMFTQHFLCPLCNCVYNSIPLLNKHLKKHGINAELEYKEEDRPFVLGSYECTSSNCNFKTRDFQSLQSHLSENHSLGRISEEQEDMTKFKIIHRCQQCNQVYMSKLRLDNHFLNKHICKITRKKTTAILATNNEQNCNNAITSNTLIPPQDLSSHNLADNEVAQTISAWESQNNREPFENNPFSPRQTEGNNHE